MDQGSADWFAARLGRVTASRVADVMAKTKSGYGASRKNYMMELLCQRLTGKREDSYTNAAMQRGTDLEPIARGRYEIESDILVDEIGIVNHPTIENFAASPDGLVGDKGMLEIKCPNTSTHVDFLQSGKIPLKYQTQMTVQMMCAVREWCDFVSFDDRLPEHLQYRCVRFELNADRAKKITTGVEIFLKELDELIEKLGEANE
jgi:putative phage-type endonuclease